MVDRIARDKYAELIRHFCAGLMTNDEYEDRADAIIENSQDKALFQVYATVWCLYDDMSTHRMTGSHRLGRKTRRKVAQCLLFLQSEREYLWPANCRYALIRIDAVGVGSVGLYFTAALLWLGPVLLTAAIISFVVAGLYWDRLNKRFGDEEAWPFVHFSDVDEARRHPRLLNGG